MYVIPEVPKIILVDSVIPEIPKTILIDIVSFISNTSREYKYFYFRRFNNYTIVFISEIVIQNSDSLRLSKWHRSNQIKNTS